MHTLKAILIGIESRVLPDVEHGLHAMAAAIEAQFPSLADAHDRLALSGTEKRVLIVQAVSDADRPALQRLIDRFPAHPVVLLTPAAATSDAIVAWMRSGVSQVVRLPFVMDDFRDAVVRIARQAELHESAGTLIAVAGAAEGCGATTIALNLATEIVDRMGKNVLLAEAPHRLGRLAVALNVQPTFTTHDLSINSALADLDTLRKAVTPIRERLGLLSGPYQSLPTNLTPDPRIINLLGLFRQLADVVIFDMPYLQDDVYFQVLAGMDHVVLVADQNVPSLHALMLCREAIQGHRVSAHRHLVINRYRPDHPAPPSRTCGRCCGRAIPFGSRRPGRRVDRAERRPTGPSRTARVAGGRGCGSFDEWVVWPDDVTPARPATRPFLSRVGHLITGH